MYPGTIRLMRMFLLLLVGFTGIGWITSHPASILASQHSAQADSNTWQTYVSPDAAYTIDLPPAAEITESDDAALRYQLLFVNLPDASTQLYQGISVLVLESDLAPAAYVEQAYAEVEGLAPPTGTPLTINGSAALQLERDPVVGDGDKYTTLVAGAGVLYRINLFGGGKGGFSEPSPQAVANYRRSVNSFQVLDVPLQPKPQAAQSVAPPATLAVADRFTWPLQSAQGVNYGIPEGLVVAGTHVEHLGYAIRNLDQWGVKCYGVDWSRMLHTGEDWYRLDGASTAGAPVYAVADGVVAKHNPGISYPGNVVMIRHLLADGRDLYSMYGHITNVRVVEGQTVTMGQQIATVLNQGYTGRTPNQHSGVDAHLHFEMRWFLDGTNIYVPGTNAYNYNYPGCTYAYPGRGYTYIIHPDNYPYPGKGYVGPSAFIRAHLDGGPTATPTRTPPPSPTSTGTPPPTATPNPTATPTKLATPTGQPTASPTPAPQRCEYIRNGDFEAGPNTASWTATNSQNRTDSLIYRTSARTGLYGGWFGAVLNYTDTLKQTVTLPDDRDGATLRFWRYVRSSEAAGSGQDTLQVLLVGANGSEQVIKTITTAVTRNQWTLETMPLDLNNVSTGSIELAFRGTNNATFVSDFFIDDVSLTMPCGTGAQDAAAAVAAPVPVEVADDTTAAAAPVAAASCSNLLRDSGFESGRLGVGWAAIANTSTRVYGDPAIYTRRPRTGSYGAWLGANNLNYVWNELVQTVQLPANVTSVQLRYWRYLETAETSRTVVYDRFTVGLETEKGVQIGTPQQIDNTSSGRGTWVQQTLELSNAANYRGQPIWVSFKATTDGNQPSSLYVDDVELIVCSG